MRTNQHPKGLWQGWRKTEISTLKRFKSPSAVQGFLDSIPYNSEPVTRPPRLALQHRRAHCFEGAMLAAAALRWQGRPPWIIDLLAENDDDHVLCLYQERGHWGAIGKSNFASLRFREPVYRSLRELCMSYFDGYYNTLGERSLRGHSLAFDLSRMDRWDWMGSVSGVERVEARLERIRHFALVSPAMVGALHRVDARSFAAGMVGTDPKGLYQAKS